MKSANVLLMFVAIAPVSGLGQQSFFDSFDDPSLGNWNRHMECVSSFDYTVSNSMLHVTKMNYPICRETVWLVGRPNLKDTTEGFEMSVRVGWEDKAGRFRFMSKLGSATSQAIMDAGPGWVSSAVYAGSGVVGGGSISAPRSGFFTLRIAQHGTLVKTYFDDVLLAQANTDIVRSETQVWIGFYAPDDKVQMGYHVDWAEGHPVPEPATLLALASGIGAWGWVRRTRRA